MDTQTVSFWYDESRPQHRNVCRHIEALPDNAQLRVSAITLGEITFGHSITIVRDLAKQAALIKFLKERFPSPLAVTQSTVTYYGELRAELFLKYRPRGKKQRRPEDCFDPITSKELGIDENDLWIASQAYEHNLVLVTDDRMCRIRDVAGARVKVENWTDPI